MWELDCKESWAPKNWCFWTVVLKKTLESPLDCKEIQPVHLKGNQSWIFIGRTDAEAETPILWPTDAKNWLIGKDPDAGKYWRQKKGMTEDEMCGCQQTVANLKDMGIPGDLTCLLGKLYADQKATVRNGHGTTDWFNIGKGGQQDCILSHCLFNFYAEYIMWNTWWMNHKLDSRCLGEISIISDMQMITLMAEIKEELKSL